MSSFPNKNKKISLTEELIVKQKMRFGDFDIGLTGGKLQQYARFTMLLFLLKYLPCRPNLRLLDVGCGFGDLYDFLRINGFLSKYKIKYTGVDLSSKMIEICKQRFPKVNFEVRDIFETKKIRSYDIVVSSAIFNLKLANRRQDHLKWVFRTLKKMYSISKLGIAADFQSKEAHKNFRKRPKKTNLLYLYNACEIIKMGRKITPNYILHHGYAPFLFCLFLLK